MVKAMQIHDVPSRAGDSSDLLFLDVDGVLHPVGADYSFSSRFFSHLPRLEALLREFESVDVIISSDWRLAESIEQEIRRTPTGSVSGRRQHVSLNRSSRSWSLISPWKRGLLP
jgi:hypothetical protein